MCCVRLFRVSACTTSRDQWDDAPRSPLSYCGIPFSCEYSRSFGNQWLQTNCSFVLDSSWREGDKAPCQPPLGRRIGMKGTDEDGVASIKTNLANRGPLPS